MSGQDIRSLFRHAPVVIVWLCSFT